MSSMKKLVAALLVVIFAVGGIVIMKMNTKFSEQENVKLIFAVVPGKAAVDAAYKFKDLCAEYSGGKIQVDVFSDNILGDDKTVVEGAQVGDIDIAMSSTSPLANMYADYYIYDAPYLFLSPQEVYAVAFNGEVGKKIRDGVEKIGLKGMPFWENGFRNLTNSRQAVASPADLSGMKIRTMENRVHMAAWRALGANPTPMAFTEVFTALQQKTIDGQENPLGQIDASRLYEPNKFITISQHVYTPYCVLMNLEKWNSLTQEQRDIIYRAMTEAAEYQIQLSQGNEGKIIKMLEENGNVVTLISPEEKKAFQDLIVNAGVHEMAQQKMEHPEYFDQMRKELEEYRQRGAKS
ncbi:TRAP transporter substrate-binding protein [Selenomonas sp. TAMA-11512]|uniref:DctP family TRAP transporter solute-binding subunit n=1 Tax=Selenomonas sp. TAMA-11512 TaxID=3095337 RepID=UPI0030907F2F|nr:TRAP transporter substrate-binding protein [Selenomonas sp. TAMA-11512]